MQRFVRFLVPLLLLCSAASVAQSAANDQQADGLAIVSSGYVAYKNAGAEAAVRAWIKGSPVDGSKDALAQANSLKQIEDLYGPFRSWHLVASQSFGPDDRFYYAVMSYRDAAVYAKFEIFRGAKGWILDSFSFNTAIEKEFPQSLLDSSMVLMKPTE